MLPFQPLFSVKDAKPQAFDELVAFAASVDWSKDHAPYTFAGISSLIRSLDPMSDDPELWQNTLAFRKAAQEIVAYVAQKCAKPARVFSLNSLKARSEIPWHIDNRAHHQGIYRVHIPVLNTEGTTYHFSQPSSVFVAEAGTCYSFDHTQSHSVKNNGDLVRVNLILDLVDQT